jgi:hypothetical protein
MMRKLAGLIIIAVLLANVALAESIDGDPIIITSGNLHLGDVATTGIADTPGLIRWYDNNGEYFTITAADMVANIAFTWPVTDGDADQVLTTDGAGVLTWEDVVSYWQRNGIILSPLNANDTVTIPGTAEDLLLLEYTGGDASGATIEFYHNSATPADNDHLGELIFQGEDSGGGIDDYVAITAYAEDVTAGTEDGGLGIEVSVNGALKRVFDIWEDLVAINDGSNDIDFRVEGDTDSHLLFIDAGTDRIGISDTTPDALLDIEGDGTTTGECLRVTRDLASGSTDSPVVLIIQDNASDDQIALSIRQEGSATAIYGYNTVGVGVTGTSTDSIALYGVSINDSAVVGTGGSGNDDYGTKSLTTSRSGKWNDYVEQASDPAVAPNAGEWRTYFKSDGMYYIEDDSTVVGPLGSGGGASLWTDGGATTYLTSTTDDFAIGGSDITAACFIDESLARAYLTGSSSRNGWHINNTNADGDPCIWYQLSGVTKFTMGVNDGASDMFQIHGASVLSSSPDFSIAPTSGNIGMGRNGGSTPLHVYENTTATGNAGVTIDQDGTGDSALHQALTGGQHFVMGIDNSALGDPWVLTDGTALSTGTDRMSINGTTGALTLNEAYELPAADGTDGEVLTTDGANTVTWESPQLQADTIYGQQLAQETTSSMTWDEGVGTGAFMPAAAVAAPTYVYNFATNKMTTSDGIWEWVARRQDSTMLWMQSDIATGGQWDCLGTMVKVSVKYRVSAAAHFDGAVLYLGSNDGTSGTTWALGALANNTWDIQENTFDIGASGLNWGIAVGGNVGLHAGARFNGKTLSNLDTFATTLEIEWIQIEQWTD